MSKLKTVRWSALTRIILMNRNSCSPAAMETLAIENLLDLPALAVKLRGKNPLAQYLRSRLSNDTQELLTDYDGDRNLELKEALVRDFNAIILGPSIYEEQRFREVELRRLTQELINQNPQGGELGRLNRLLLEDAYPRELVRKLKS